MKLEERMNRYHAQLNENDRHILNQIILHAKEYADKSSDELASLCHVSRATLLRLCRKIDLASFSDLKLTLTYAKQDQTNQQELPFDSICTTYHTLLDDLRKFSYIDICKLIHQSKNIYIYGTGNEQKTLADEFKRIFLSAGICVIDLFDYGEVAFVQDTFCEHDLFILISLSGETPEGIHILQRIAPYNIQTLSITRLQNNTISRLCNHNLYVATKKLGNEVSSYELVSVFYVLLDYLFIHYLEYTRGRNHEH